MYNELCLTEKANEEKQQEKAKLQRDVDALIKQIAVKERDSAHLRTEV